VAAIERRVENPSQWTSPHPSTVNALAQALALRPGSTAHREFLEAAAMTRSKPLPEPPAEALPEPPVVTLPGTFDASHLDGIAQDASATFVAAGRQEHLDHIAQKVRDSAGGTPGMVFVSAEAGTGKTWLVSEAARRAVQTHPDLVVLWGNSTGRLGAADPFQPFRQILRTMVGDMAVASPQHLVSGQNGQRILDRLPVALDALCKEGLGLMHRLLAPAALENPQLQLLTDPVHVDQTSSLMTSSPSGISEGPDTILSRVLRHYSQAGPTLLVLEDLHWTDASTATVLFKFLEDLQASESPILVLGTFRPGDLIIQDPDEEHPLPPLLQQTADVFPNHVIDLSTSLDVTGGRAFVSEVSTRHGHAIDERELDAIYARTRGLPIIVNGLLRLHGGNIRKFADAASKALKGEVRISPPAEIRAMFEGQLDRLDDDVRNLLAFASVQGNGFSAEILMKAAGISSEHFDRMVTRAEFPSSADDEPRSTSSPTPSSATTSTWTG
jgi:predicted ATPase